jgi:hypothetical protein
MSAGVVRALTLGEVTTRLARAPTAVSGRGRPVVGIDQIVATFVAV